jgi:hypothetical protein
MHDPARFRFSFVLVALLVYWVVAPLLRNFIGVRVLTDVFFSATLISAVYAVSQVRRHAFIAAALALPMLLSLWLQYFEYLPSLDLVGSVFEMLFFGYTAWLILGAVLRASEVSREVIVAAIVAYMFLGILWTGAYSTLELLQPGTFAVPDGFSGPVTQHLGYFSFTTLTTLGYGDVSPVSAMAKSLATLEALVGQIYLAVLIARLVGIYTARSRT